MGRCYLPNRQTFVDCWNNIHIALACYYHNLLVHYEKCRSDSSLLSSVMGLLSIAKKRFWVAYSTCFQVIFLKQTFCFVRILTSYKIVGDILLVKKLIRNQMTLLLKNQTKIRRVIRMALSLLYFASVSSLISFGNRIIWIAQAYQSLSSL